MNEEAVPTATAALPQDDWQPGAPSLRAIAPSAVGGALVPLSVYYAVRHAVGSDASALAIAGIPASGWVLWQWIRQRRLDPIGAGVLFGFIAGLSISFALGGNAFVLKARDSVLTGTFGVVCLGSLLASKPLMFYLGRSLSAGSDPEKVQAYNDLWEVDTAQRVFAIITAVWGVGLLLEAGMRIMLALELATGPFLAVSPVVAGVFFAGLFGFTVAYSRRARERYDATEAAEAL